MRYFFVQNVHKICRVNEKVTNVQNNRKLNLVETTSIKKMMLILNMLEKTLSKFLEFFSQNRLNKPHGLLIFDNNSLYCFIENRLFPPTLVSYFNVHLVVFWNTWTCVCCIRTTNIYVILFYSFIFVHAYNICIIEVLILMWSRLERRFTKCNKLGIKLNLFILKTTIKYIWLQYLI